MGDYFEAVVVSEWSTGWVISEASEQKALQTKLRAQNSLLNLFKTQSKKKGEKDRVG